MTEHAKLSASGSPRWLNCLGSVKAEEGLEDKPSDAASEGTLAHALGERCLLDNIDCHKYSDEELDGQLVPHEMTTYVQDYVDYVNENYVFQQDELLIEEKLDFSEWVPDGFGTSDATIIKPAKREIEIVDLKYGKGVQVFAENNSQLMLYALGAYSCFEFIYEIKQFKLTIVQPRLDHIDSWVISLDELLKWGSWVSEQCEIILGDTNPPRTPGEKQCQWCKAKATCPALLEQTQKIIMREFQKLEQEGTTPPDKLTDKQLGEVVANKKLIESWFKAVDKYALEKAMSDGFEGYKVVEGRSLRKWKDESAAGGRLRDVLGDDAYERKLLSPSKAEKALGKNRKGIIQDYIIKPPGAPTLVPDSDPRPPLQATAADFEDFNDD